MISPFFTLAGFNQVLQELVDTDVNALVEVSVANRSDIFVDRAAATFNTHNKPVCPASVTVNSIPLDKEYSIYTKSFSFADSSSIRWEILDYDGGTFRDTTTMPEKLAVPFPTFGDTVSRSSGFTIPYSGAGIEQVIAYVRFHYGLTLFFIDSVTAARSTGYLGKFAPDSGSITFNPEELSNFTTDNYISVEIIRFRYHVRNSSNGYKVGVLTQSSSYVTFYLKP